MLYTEMQIKYMQAMTTTSLTFGTRNRARSTKWPPILGRWLRLLRTLLLYRDQKVATAKHVWK